MSMERASIFELLEPHTKVAVLLKGQGVSKSILVIGDEGDLNLSTVASVDKIQTQVNTSFTVSHLYYVDGDILTALATIARECRPSEVVTREVVPDSYVNLGKLTTTDQLAHGDIATCYPSCHTVIKIGNTPIVITGMFDPPYPLTQVMACEKEGVAPFITNPLGEWDYISSLDVGEFIPLQLGAEDEDPIHLRTFSDDDDYPTDVWVAFVKDNQLVRIQRVDPSDVFQQE